MAKRLLLIQPLALPENEAATEIAVLRKRFPNAVFTLLADPVVAADVAAKESADKRLTVLPIPSRSAGKAAWLQTARQLRREPFSEVVILTGVQQRPLSGHLEYKAWAFLARARTRRLGRRRLHLMREVSGIAYRLLSYQTRKTHRQTTAPLAFHIVMWRIAMRLRSVDLSQKARIRRLLNDWDRNAAPITHCAICGVALRDWERDLGARHRRCPKCETIYLIHKPTSAAVEAFYSEDYFQGEACEHWKHSFQNREARRLEAHVYLRRHDQEHGAARGDYLDVGCARGYYLETAKQFGWNAHGLDVGHWAVEYNRERGYTVWEGDLPSFRCDVKFQFMTLIDVLEHLPDPVAAFQSIKDLLEPGGVCLLRTPDAAKATRARHFLDEISHLCLISESGIRKAADRVGLRVLDASESLFDEAQWDIWLSREESPI